MISGRKVWVANAEAADVMLVFAATQPGMRGRGVSAFLVPHGHARHQPRVERRSRSASADSAAWISS